MIKYDLNNINDWNFDNANINKVYYGVTNLSRLPNGYTEVEYVENTGTSYINTNFVPNQDTRILCTMQCVTSANSTLHLGAGGWDKTTGMWLTYENGITGTLHLSWGNSTRWSVYNNVHGDYDVHTYDWNKNQFYKDDVLVGSITYASFTCSDNLGIFTTIQNGVAPTDVIFKGKLYSFKIYDNDTLVRDFIPCTRDSDSKAGVYDIVNDVFYSSARSGVELVAGNAVPSSIQGNVVYQKLTTGDTPTPPTPSVLPSGYTEVEYIQSTSTAYIDTGAYLNTSNFEIGYTIVNKQQLFGYCHQGCGNCTWLGVEQSAIMFWGKNDNNANISSYLTSGDNTIIFTPSGATINGTSISKTLSIGRDDIRNISLLIFARYDFNNNVIEHRTDSYMQLKSFYLKNNGTLVRDFVPCTRDSDSKAGVYDIVNDVFYSSASNDELVAGPTV